MPWSSKAWAPQLPSPSALGPRGRDKSSTTRKYPLLAHALWGEDPANGHELEQTLGDNGGQGSLACCSPWSREELGTT